MKILIPTQSHDIHATAVAAAIATKGHEAVLWYASDLPTQQTMSLNYDGRDEPQLELHGVDLDHHGTFDVVWLRRPASPVLPDTMHPGDHTFAVQEWRSALEGVWDTLSASGFWINPRIAARRAESKPAQLAAARRVGLDIPATLLSNDPQRIRSFIRANSPTETIYKPFATTQWDLGDGAAAYLFTAVVDEAGLPPDEILRLTPGIFQPRLAKAHELRVTFMGEHMFVARLGSQAVDGAEVDWRIKTRAVATEVGVLPAKVEMACRALMRTLGLVFACFDFIVTPDGKHVFLEVNQMGQFLWLEELAPEMPLLDAFCEFLIQGRPDFRWRAPAPNEGLRFKDFSDEATQTAIDQRHVDRPHVLLLPDDPRGDAAA
ncbi:MvdC/MvdD family ATP grasp protein [Enhygromyxa salina]|uniref:MvdD-like pre-ATP grasp domain-containing protein n=1 Tax=Enhygromyxa salina TaxID=215803 RepID=A0A2S9YSX4_9BACT|nr:hypothetical protein [Enhygromyxa salina]PRQ08186.1 hypothetical protein ENSA7_21580 [Enhygromyxa salina]